jgi:hypothetical protein
MSSTSEYRGISYAIPRTDDGAWRWVIYPRRDVKRLAAVNAPPRPVYGTYIEAVAAAKRAIDALLQ